jgi:cytochrome P450
MANAIEELLRCDSSVQVADRTALEEVDEIGGIRSEKGRSVVCLLGSANRDPATYRDRSAQWDSQRRALAIHY